MDDLPEPIPAATLILMRPGREAPELLMMERAATMAFAAGALVFPGGRVDPQDYEAAQAYPNVEDAAHRLAAIRETIEETGVAPALGLEAPAEKLRTGLHAGDNLAQLLAADGMTLDLAALTPFARWCPNFKETRRFDARFYLAEAPIDAPEPQIDPNEGVRAFWASATDILADADAGRAHIIFPTRRNLERLAGFTSIEEARASAARYPVRKIVPWVEERGGERWLCIPDDTGYPVTAERLASAKRG